MRAIGGFLVSADFREGKVKQISIHSEKGGTLKLWNPFKKKTETIQLKAGEILTID